MNKKGGLGIFLFERWDKSKLGGKLRKNIKGEYKGQRPLKRGGAGTPLKTFNKSKPKQDHSKKLNQSKNENQTKN